jgi:hypothetical protein
VEAAAGFDVLAAEADSRQFAAVYTPVSILPPDRYLALVIQITEGCHWNRCTFCSFYRRRPFRVKSLPEFASHVAGVIDFFGRGLALRRGIFLGDANALLLPADALEPRLDLLARRLPVLAGDTSAFIDVFTGHRRSAGDFAAMRARGLRRIYLGMETGDDELLTCLNKPQTVVEAAKSAGVHVGVIVRAGVGGRAYRDRHVRATLDALSRMRLGGGDLVYVSAFEAPADGPYADWARGAGITALALDEVSDQVEELLRATARIVGAGTRVAPYDIQEFLY